MRKITTLITTVLMSVQGVPAYAIGEEGSEFYGSSDGWDVYKTVVPGTRNRCELVALTHRHSLLVAFDPIRDALLLGFTIEDGSNFPVGKDVELKIGLGNKVGPDHPMIPVDASTSNGTDVESHRTFYARLPDAEPFLRDFSSAEFIAVFTDPGLRTLLAIDLKGSAKAVALLRKCAYSLKPQ